MKKKELAEYYGVTISAVNQWSAATLKRKTIEAQSGVEPEIAALIAEISRLCYVYNCENISGEKVLKAACFGYSAAVAQFRIVDTQGRGIFNLPPIDLNQSTAVAELQKIKSTLESFVY